MDFQTFGASAAGTVVSKILCFPFDTLSIQAQSATRRPFFSVPLKTYYRGIQVALGMTTPAAALYYCTYFQTKTYLTPRLGDGTITYAIAGMTAEVASSVLWTPMEVMKARLQISRTAQDGKFSYQVKEILAREGLRGFYRGYQLGLLYYIPYNALAWSVYENVKKGLKKRGVREELAVGGGSIASVAAAVGFIHPLELVKTRFQVASSGTIRGEGRASDALGVRAIASNVLREGGWKGFYAGFMPRLATAVPGTVITMSVIEALKPKPSPAGGADLTAV